MVSATDSCRLLRPLPSRVLDHASVKHIGRRLSCTKYLICNTHTTQARIVELTLEAAAYARHLGQERPVSADGCSFYSLPRPVYIQLYALAYHRFHATECALLHELDRLVFWKKDNRSWRVDSSCSDPLILALCIRRMALHYRALMVRYKCFGSGKSANS